MCRLEARDFRRHFLSQCLRYSFSIDDLSGHSILCLEYFKGREGYTLRDNESRIAKVAT